MPLKVITAIQMNKKFHLEKGSNFFESPANMTKIIINNNKTIRLKHIDAENKERSKSSIPTTGTGSGNSTSMSSPASPYTYGLPGCACLTPHESRKN